MLTKPSGLTGALLVRIICNYRNIPELNFVLFIASVPDAVVVEAEVPDVEVVLCSNVSSSRVEVARDRGTGIYQLVKK